jgi:hypothetical protein
LVLFENLSRFRDCDVPVGITDGCGDPFACRRTQTQKGHVDVLIIELARPTRALGSQEHTLDSIADLPDKLSGNSHL